MSIPLASPCSETLGGIARRVASGELSCREVMESCLERIEAVDSKVGALLSLRSEEALREAEAADQARSSGAARSPLHGLPIAVKDNLVSPSFETRCA